MTTFSASGHDVVLCQVCGALIDTGKVAAEWRPDITGSQICGQVCQECVEAHDVPAPAYPARDADRARERERQAKTSGGDFLSLHEHCRQESGLDGAALERYINRYYGHG